MKAVGRPNLTCENNIKTGLQKKWEICGVISLGPKRLSVENTL
jgi:hypothetical protein